MLRRRSAVEAGGLFGHSHYTVALCLALMLGALGLSGCSSGTDGNAGSSGNTPNTQANLSNLVLSAGTLNPAFSPSATSYNTMFIGDTSVTVTPTSTYSRAMITVNGTPVVSGQASLPIVLPAGTTTITIQVRTVDGATTKTYIVSARRLSQEAYVKASNTGRNDQFGTSVALSGDTLVVGAPGESSNAKGVNGDQFNDNSLRSGAVYVFTKSNGIWTQQAYLKASNADPGDGFGTAVTLSGDTLAVSAPNEDSNATGVNGIQTDNSVEDSGAVYVFTRNNGAWSQQAYLKPSAGAGFTNDLTFFGGVISLSGDTLAVSQIRKAERAYVFIRTGTTWTQQVVLTSPKAGLIGFGGVVLDGDTLAVSAPSESSNARGVNGDQTNNNAVGSGAVYVFTRVNGVWGQPTYLKASITDADDAFGASMALSGDTLAVGALNEDSAATGVNGDQLSNGAFNSGAVYVFTRADGFWAQQAYLKASNTEGAATANGPGDQFGWGVALSGDTLAISAPCEDGGAQGLNGDQSNNASLDSGAVYLFQRRAGIWAQRGYLKASNNSGFTFSGCSYGRTLALAQDTLAIGSPLENSDGIGINGEQWVLDVQSSGSVYVHR